MIDILLIEISGLAILLFLGRRLVIRWKTTGILAGAAFFFHLVTLLLLMGGRELEFRQILYPSPAASSGIVAPGRIESVDGESASSLWSYLSAWSGKERGEISISGGRKLEVSSVKSPRFFEPVDSYYLAESSGGLVVFERDPVIFFLPYEITGQGYCTKSHWVRAERVNALSFPTASSLVAALSALPDGGIATLRISCPDPDSDLRTILATNDFLRPYHFLENLAPSQAWQMFLGFSGLPVKLALPGSRGPKVAVVFSVNGLSLTGPGQLSAAIGRFRNKENIRLETIAAHLQLIQGESFHLDLAPGFALFPWIGKSFPGSLFAGHPGIYFRQLLSSGQLSHLFDLWHLVPKQAYLIPEREILSPAYVFYRAASVLASLVLACVLWLVLFGKVERILKGRPLVYFRLFFLAAVCSYLQALDILVFHHIA